MEHIKFLDELEMRTNDLKSTIKKYRDCVYKAKNPQVTHLLLATLMLMAEQNVIFLLRQITEIKEVIKSRLLAQTASAEKPHKKITK